MLRATTTPPLATPGLVINQTGVPGVEPGPLQEYLDRPADVDMNAPDAVAPLVIKETIESLRTAIREPGDTPIDFMVLATALRFHCRNTHIRVVLSDRRAHLHHVNGGWAIETRTVGRSYRGQAFPATAAADVAPAPNPDIGSVENTTGMADIERDADKGPDAEADADNDTRTTTGLQPISAYAAFQHSMGQRAGLEMLNWAALDYL